MNCKNSAQNALKVASFRLKVERFSGKGAMPLPRPFPHWGGDTPSPNHTPSAPSAPRSSRLRRSTLPLFTHPGSATECYAWVQMPPAIITLHALLFRINPIIKISKQQANVIGLCQCTVYCHYLCLAGQLYLQINKPIGDLIDRLIVTLVTVCSL